MNDQYNFHRGDKVNFMGGMVPTVDDTGKVVYINFAPNKNTYVWGILPHEEIHCLVEHPDGDITKETLKKKRRLCTRVRKLLS